jgi:hypothetical protein
MSADLVVFDGIELRPVPSPAHGYLMTTGEVAAAYNISHISVRIDFFEAGHDVTVSGKQDSMTSSDQTRYEYVNPSVLVDDCDRANRRPFRVGVHDFPTKC